MLGRAGDDRAPPPEAPEGDEAAFFALLGELTPTLLRLAAALVGPDDAEDAVQEAVMRAWRAWPSLRDPAAASPWLLRIVGNVCRDWRRGPFGMRQRLQAPLDSAVDERGVSAIYGGQAFAAAGANADPGGAAHVDALDVRRVVNTLDDELRVVVALRYFVGMDATAIGAALNTPPATIRTRLRRALGVLRKRLDAPPTTPPAPPSTLPTPPSTQSTQSTQSTPPTSSSDDVEQSQDQRRKR
jgi:RNA polymerase sigma-70 factor (ECF subfamily)